MSAPTPIVSYSPRRNMTLLTAEQARRCRGGLEPHLPVSTSATGGQAPCDEKDSLLAR